MPLELLALLEGKDVLLGAIDVANDDVESPEEVFAIIEQATRVRAGRAHLPVHQLRHGADDADLAYAKLDALGAGAKLARERLGWVRYLARNALNASA